MIRLTGIGTHEPIYISPESITSICGYDNGCSQIYSGSDLSVVTESPEEVARKVLEWQTAYRKNDIDTLYRLAGLKEPWKEEADKVIDGLIEKLGLEEQA